MKLMPALFCFVFLLSPQFATAKKGRKAKRVLSKQAQFRKQQKLGKKYYKLKKYREALASFLIAIKLNKKKGLYFNIAQCYRFIDKPEEALKYYELFYVALDSIQRLNYGQRKFYKGEIGKRIKEMKQLVLKYRKARSFLEKQRKQEKRALRQRIEKQREELLMFKRRKAKESALTNKWWFWGGIGATTLFVVSTTLFGMKALSAADAWEESWIPANRDAIKKYRNYADLSLGAAVISGVGTLIYTMYFKLKLSKEPPASKRRFTVVPGCTGTSCSVNFMVMF